MNFLNIKNVHDNIKTQLKFGLEKATTFLLKNNGSAISMVDDANTVHELVVGGNAGFTITYSGGYITFSANSGKSPLAIKEPNMGGIPGCAFYYCHQDKYSGGGARSIQNNATSEIDPEQCSNCQYNMNTIPSAENYPGNSILVSQNGKWVAIEYDELLETLKNDLKINT